MDNYQIDSYSGAEIEALLGKIDDLGNASQSSAGLMSAADKTKLDGLDSGAQANVLEGVKIAGADLPITEKKVNIPADSSPTSGSNSLVRSGGVFNAIKDFITRSVNDLVNYYTKTEVNNIIGSLQQFHYEIYASTSAVTNPQSNVLYLIGPTGTGSDKYEEYVYSDGWVKIGDTTIDLSGYPTTEQMNAAINNALMDYATKEEVSQLGQKINMLDADVDSTLEFEVGTIDTATGINYPTNVYRNRARNKSYVSSPFEILLNDGFVINNILRYSKNIDGTIAFVGAIPVSNLIPADNYLYRITIKKSNNEEIVTSELETAVSTFRGKLDYTIADIDKKKAPLYNVNKLLDTPTTFYTLSQAITALPSALRAMGCILTFRMSNTVWGFYQYVKSIVSDNEFLNVDNWNSLGAPRLNFSVHSGLNKTTGKSEFLISDYYSTPFLRCQQGLHIKAYEGTNNAACCFYDEQFNFISALALPTGVAQFVLGSTGYEIPSDATFFRASGYIDDYIIEMVVPAADAYMVENWQNSPQQNFEQWFIKGKAYSVGSLNIGDTVTMSDNGVIECLRILVKQGDVFYVDAAGAGGPRLWAWCDSEMKLISRADASVTFAGYITAPANGYLLVNNWLTTKPIAHVHKVNYIVEQDALIDKANWLAMGDSITQGWYSYRDETYPNGHGVNNPVKGWVYKMSKITGKSVTNRGIGGTGYVCVGTSASDINARQLIDSMSATDFADKQLVTLAYGINDYKKGDIVLGTMQDDVSVGGTVISNMRYVIEKIQQFNPLIKIIVITPFNAQGYYGQRLGDETTNYAIGYTKNGKTLQDYYEAFVEVCEYYGIQYIDATHTSLISRKAIPEQLPDGVHPSEDAHTIIAREFSQRITMY